MSWEVLVSELQDWPREGGNSLLCIKTGRRGPFAYQRTKAGIQCTVSKKHEGKTGKNSAWRSAGCCGGSCHFGGRATAAVPNPYAEPWQEQAHSDLCRCFLPIKRQQMCRFYTWKSNVFKGILFSLGI